jgi:tRNA1(Val) A37 N6-methylase TrmN6
VNTTCDKFLGGKINAFQPRDGYRAGVDAVFLAASVIAKAGQSVLELGCGVGVASLCLAARLPGLEMTGVEVQPEYAELARRNAEYNTVALSVVTSDLRSLPLDLRQKRFHHVIMNPPYFDSAKGSSSVDVGRDIALRGDTALIDWIDVASRRLQPRGHLTLIQHIERLPEVVAAVEPCLGSIQIAPLVPRSGRDAHLFLLRAKKEGRAKFRLHPPKTLHLGNVHSDEHDSYVPSVSDVLRFGAEFCLWD